MAHLPRLESRNCGTRKTRAAYHALVKWNKLHRRDEPREEGVVNLARWLWNRSGVWWRPIVAGAGIVLAVLGGARHASAQERKSLEITPMVGWQYGGTIDAAQGGDIHFNAGWNYGGALGIQMEPSLT